MSHREKDWDDWNRQDSDSLVEQPVTIYSIPSTQRSKLSFNCASASSTHRFMSCSLYSLASGSSISASSSIQSSSALYILLDSGYSLQLTAHSSHLTSQSILHRSNHSFCFQDLTLHCRMLFQSFATDK